MTKRRVVYRSAETGKYVTRGYAERNESTTVAERVGPVKAAVAAVAARYTKGRRTN